MLPTASFEATALKLLETNDPSVRLQIATEIRDNIEIVHTPEYRTFLHHLFPVFYNILRQTPPQFTDGPDQKLRNVLLEILNRLPNNDFLRPYVPNLLKLSMYLLEVENEENAVICLRIIIDLHKNYRPTLEGEVQPFLDVVQKIYSELPKTVSITFKGPPQQQPGQERGAALTRSMQSFKVLTECPIIVVLLFQLYPRFLTTNIPKFMPLIVSTLGLQAPPPTARQHHAYVDFIASQVKTLSFLAYMLRGFAEHLRPYQDSIPRCVIQLLLNCPSESAGIRKELLIATRHILATDFRQGFVSQIDTLLDEKVIIGTGRTSHETLRPLAYSTLADLVHHVRQDLTLPQLSRVVHLYSRNIHDSTLPFAIQTMSAKLLLNLVECIAKRNEADGKGRALLVRILDAFVNKFSSLKKQIPKLLSKQVKAHKGTDNIKDCRLLMKNLVLGLKNIVWGISSCTPNYRGFNANVAHLPKTMSLEESLIFTRLLKNGLKCFTIYSSGPNASPTDEKEILDHFAAVFTMVDSRVFQDVFSLQMNFLFQRTLENQTMLALPQHFLANPSVSRVFADILLNFLIDRMNDLAGTDKTPASVLLKLFKLVFGSVTLFADNETILQPHLSTIVTSALKHAAEVKDSFNYFILLRGLFRSIGNGKFDLFAKDFLPLLPSLIEGLNRLQCSSHPQNVRDLFVELALTIPVRLANLLPCLRLLMKPLVLAVESSSDLVIQGLRFLETCVDGLAFEFLDPLLATVQPELTLALWKHLKAGSPHNAQVLRIFGKLGGRNRQFIQIPFKSKVEEHMEFGYCLRFALEQTKSPITVPTDKFAEYAKQKLGSNLDVELKAKAFQLLKIYLNAVVPDLAKNPDGMETDEASRKKAIAAQTSPAENALIKNAIDGVIMADSHEKLQEAQSYFENLCKYFSPVFLEVPQSVSHSGLFIDALIDAITAENRAYSKSVLKAFDLLIESCAIGKSNEKPVSVELRGFDEIAKKLARACYRQEWYFRSGGCLGISHLVTKMQPNWVIKSQMIFIKALIFVLKDLPAEISLATIEEASEAISSILKTCNSRDLLQIPQNKQIFSEVVALLTSELSSSIAIVRSNVQKYLQLLSEISGIGLSELIEPFKGPLLANIYSKPLRSLQVLAQTGNLEAITFCLDLKPSIITFSPELVRFLQSALAIADKEEVTTSKGAHSQKTVQLLTSLRMAAIELLSAAMSCPDFQGAEQLEFRNRTIGVFFKSLTLRSKEIVEVAKKGLAQVTTQGKIPKDLLQSSLRPILLNLADYRKLSVPLLQGLARLLELLTNCFNVTLGERLLEHLNKWTEPTNVTGAKIWKEGEETKIAPAIIEIFHLLPQTASKFLDPLVAMTIQLESQLPREVTSPYRQPLIKFLNRYPTEGCDFFLSKIAQPAYSKLFRFLLKDELAGTLREELAKHPQKLIDSTFRLNPPSLETQFQGLLLVRLLIKFSPNWLQTPANRPIIDALIEIWSSPGRISRLSNDDSLPLQYLTESKLLIICFLNYCSHHREKVDILFWMLSIFTTRTTIDYTFLKDFYSHDVAEKYTQEEKKAILVHFLTFFKDSTYTQDHKVQVLQVLITPMLTASFAQGEYKDCIDPKIISSIIGEILDPKSPGETYEESLNIELLQLATLLVRYMHSELTDHRKELIKFAWNHLKSEDTNTRQCAYVLVCRFIEAYETPPKIILQVYVALLRAFQPEARALVKQALDILTPALQKRLHPGNDAKYPTWVKWTKKIIVEEGHSLPQLIHILQLIVRHSALFYQSRSHFVPHMVNSLTRISLLPNSPHENRKLAVDLADLVIAWEKQRIEEAAVAASKPDVVMEDQKPKLEGDATAQPMDIDGKIETPTPVVPSPAPLLPPAAPLLPPAAAPGAPAQTAAPGVAAAQKPPVAAPAAPAAPAVPEVEFRISANIAEMMVNFLIRIASTGNDSPENSGLPHRALDLLKQAFTLWPNVSVKFAYFEKLLAPTDQPNLVCTGIGILNVILDYQPQRFVLDNINALQNTLTPSLTSNQLKVISALCTLLEKIMKTYPLGQLNGEINSFYNHIAEIIEASLNNYEKSNVHSVIVILKCLCDQKAEFFDRYMASTVKMIQKLAKDHVSPQGRDAADTDHVNRASVSNQSKKIIKESGATLLLSIGLVATRISQLGDNKKAFFAALLVLLEKSIDVELLTEVTKIVSAWITGENPSLNMSSREKIGFLLKMSRFEQLGNPSLQNTFLDLVYHVFNDPNSPKSDLTSLNGGFMMGLRSRVPHIRNQFFELFQRGITKTISGRLEFIFSVQSWEYMGNTFWIRQAIELLLVLGSGTIQLIPRLTKLDGSLDAQQGTVAALIPYLELMDPLKELIHQDVDLAYHLWVILFPAAWKLLGNEDRERLSRALSSFLAKEYHSKQQQQRFQQPNVIQAILEGISGVPHKERPTIPSELVKFLGKTYNAWYSAITIIEDRVRGNLIPSVETDANAMAIDQVDKQQDKDAADEELYLAELYQLLSDEDLYYCLWARRAAVEDTKAALIFEQYGMWAKAQEVYYSVMNKAQSGALRSAPLPETLLWEEHWIQCAKRLNQWDLLTEYAKVNNQNELLLDCAWKIPDWSSMKDALMRVSSDQTPQIKLLQSYTAIHDGKSQDVENLCNQAIQLALRQHQGLPDIPSIAHNPVLQSFQQIVELKESTQIIKDINGSNKNQTVNDIHAILKTWRERLPNSWEDISVWGELLSWRQHVFTLINAAFAQETNSPTPYIGHHETAWTINRFSHIARKHQLVEVCLNALSKIYTLPNIEIQDAFVKLQEQVKCYFQLPAHYRTGLDIINSTNLDYFAPQQKAEFFQLKGEFLSKMGQNEEAHSAFSTSVSICDSLAKGWLSWGLFCDHQFATSADDLIWAEYAINCHLQAVKCANERSKRLLISRVLWLLNFDDDNERLTKAFEKHSDIIPVWIWISWIPHLLSSLSRNEAPQMKNVLMKVAAMHPQALFFSLRTFLAEKREIYSHFGTSMEIDRTKVKKEEPPALAPAPTTLSTNGVPTTPTAQVTTPQTPASGPVATPTAVPQSPNKLSAPPIRQSPAKYAEEVMAALRATHAPLASDLEIMVKEISSYLQPEPSELLLQAMEHLIIHLFELPTNEITPQIAQQVKALLQFSYLEASSPATSQKISEFVAAYKPALEADFAKANNVPALLQKLKEWIPKLRAVVDQIPVKRNLEEVSPLLVEFQNSAVEIPGQYFEDVEPAPDNQIRVERFHSEVQIIADQHTRSRSIQMRGHNGKLYSFHVQTHPANLIPGGPNLFQDHRSEEKISHLFRLFSYFMNKHKETRKRNVYFNVPSIIPITPRVRLVQLEEDYISLAEMYAKNDGKNNHLAIYEPLQKYREKLITGNFNDANSRMQLYQEICSEVPNNILSHFASALHPSPAQYYTFKKQLITQHATMSTIAYLMGIRAQNQTPTTLSISKSSGGLLQSKFYPVLDGEGRISTDDAVPFRLTRNFKEFFDPMYIDGMFLGTASGTAMCFAHYKDQLKHQLTLFLRDEIIAWQTTTEDLEAESNVAAREKRSDFDARKKLKVLVESNVSTILDRIKNVAPTMQFDKNSFTVPINSEVSKLIELAQNESNISQMKPTWFPFM
eukprot:TRINITY_DN3613_c0_g1_i5.p1 TRINITY_DN3613_c0_g1~~TRINITY_DN3613_c0_g1_i5.p1  ORF type:complete len:3612 (+),score=1106.25 TRINITY_DN3613_c0_g1_i5:200-11035(+)